MFTRITRLPLRRCLHTASSGAQSAASSRPAMARVGRVALGASLVATALVSYNLSSERSRIHLDSPLTSTKLSASKPSSAAPTSSTTTPSSSSSSGPAPSSSEPKPTSSEEDSSPKPEGEDGDKSSGAGASGQQGAYNPETGEINWDCPCLGGMAHGPCGEQFKEAFSCFVFSEEEPKGINCVDAFKKMQDCFREHPEVYADEIMDDDDEDEDPSRPAPERPEGQALEKVEGAVAEASPFVPDVSEETEPPKAAVKKAKSSSKPSSPSP